jgi:hypothetical protein
MTRKLVCAKQFEPPRNSPNKVGRSDRYPRLWSARRKGERAEACQDKAPIKRLLGNANVDEEGARANVRQNTPPKGLRSKR